jgi:hypothetical protein
MTGGGAGFQFAPSDAISRWRTTWKNLLTGIYLLE